jgi:hypothetical protein
VRAVTSSPFLAIRREGLDGVEHGLDSQIARVSMSSPEVARWLTGKRTLYTL